MQEISFCDFLKQKPYNQKINKTFIKNYEIKIYENGLIQIKTKDNKKYKFYEV